MMASINLMSLQAQRHSCIRTRIRQWTCILLVVSGVLGLLTLERYFAYRSSMHQQLALEADYEPIKELKVANKSLTKQIEAIKNEEQFVLALSDQEPILTLLGLVGKSIADGQEHVFLQKIEVNNLGLAGGPPSEKKTMLDLTGVANNDAEVKHFAELLQAAVPFGKVDVSSSNERRFKTQVMQDFILQGNF
jgi:hypothetical protein